jgi:hypothetical protein
MDIAAPRARLLKPARFIRVAVAVCALFVALPAARAMAASSLASTSLAIVGNVVSQYAGPSGPFAAGVWTTPSADCWACAQGGPATGAATAYMLGGKQSPTLLNEAVQTINTAIATHQQSDGSFLDPATPGSSDITTMFFGVEFGTTYHLLSGVLDPATLARWQQSLAAAADYMIRKGTLTYYTNGNINLGEVEFFYLVWQATGNAKYDLAYEQEWATTLTPNQLQWPGGGLVISKAPTVANGSDGSGYLAEIGPGGTGFDAEYTELQLEVASRLFLLSGDPRALRIANLEVNQLLPRVNSSWMLDTSAGTRHTALNRSVNFLTPAFTVLNLFGGRADLAADVLPELNSEQAAYNQSWQAYNAVFRRSLGNDLSVSALAAALAAGGTPPPAFSGATATPVGAPAAPKPPTTTRAPTKPTTKSTGSRPVTAPGPKRAKTSSLRRHPKRTRTATKHSRGRRTTRKATGHAKRARRAS